MELKRYVPLAILSVSICLPLFFLLWNESGWLSLVFLCAFLISGTIYIVKKDHVLLFASILIASHFIYLPGIQVSRRVVFCLLAVLEAFLFFYKPLPISRTLKLFLAGIPLYFAIVLMVKPYQVNTAWLLLFAEVLLMVIFTLNFQWTARAIENIITLHLCFFILYGIVELVWFSKLRIEGPVASASAFGVVLVVDWAFWLGFQIGRPVLKWRFLVPMFVVTVVVILATGSRMSLLAMGLTLFMAVFVRITMQKKNTLVQISRLLLVASLLIGSAIVLWSILPENLVMKERMALLIQGDLDSSNKFRVFAWLGGIDAIKNHPIWGVGNGNFYNYIVVFTKKLGLPESVTGGVVMLIHPHNFFLRAWAENGLFGLVYLLLLLSYLCKNILFSGALYKSNIKIGFLFGFSILLLIDIFEVVPFYEWTIIWGGLIIALTFKTSKNELPICPSGIYENMSKKS